MTGGGWEQRVKIVGRPLGGRWGNPDCEHSNLRDGEETQAQELLSHTRQTGLSRVASNGQWGITIEVTSCCYFLLLHLPTILFFNFHLHFLKAK